MTHGRAAPGTLQLQVDETLEVLADVITALAVNPGTLTCGANPGSPVTPDYAPLFRFTGTLRTVILDVSGDIADTESEGHLAMARQ